MAGAPGFYLKAWITSNETLPFDSTKGDHEFVRLKKTFLSPYRAKIRYSRGTHGENFKRKACFLIPSKVNYVRGSIRFPPFFSPISFTMLVSLNANQFFSGNDDFNQIDRTDERINRSRAKSFANFHFLT